MNKPAHCRFCNLGAEGTSTPGLGFVPDGLYLPPSETPDLSKLRCVVQAEMPTKDEVNIGTPLAGEYGYARWLRFFQAAGWQRDEIGFTHLTRCYRWNPVDKKPGLTGASAKDAYKKCREYDRLLTAFRPDVAVISQSPTDTIQTPAYYRLIVADLVKARTLADRGLRPIVLLGDAPLRYWFPNLSGTKRWYGGWFPL